MAGEIFNLKALLTLDSSQFDSALSKVAGAFKAGMAATAAAVGAATVAMGKFALDSVQTGMAFDSAMSQVAATMGYTVEELNTAGSEAANTFETLSEFAQQMGSSTAFSASEAADALNYMALAGYDAETSMEMLPNVLNLAAAGGIGLAEASDMVTDASSALGLSLDETSALVDQMAKASSKSNTSVQQLGEAILTVGGTAKNLAGGTTELSAALGILADNGIKGAEGGTALRNIILSLTTPTAEAAKKMKQLGLEVFDANGQMRPMEEIFQDLNGTLSTMTQGEQLDVLGTLFNKVDLKSANALLATDADRWAELTDAIENADGAAQAMAEVQLDNLAGDITMFKSALEGAKIAVSQGLTPNLREFVQFGTDGISRLTAAFKEGGLSGAMSELGSILSDGIAMITENLPSWIDAGMSLLDALGQGLMDNLPLLTSSAVQILTMLGTYLIQSLPELAEAAFSIITQLALELTKSIPELIPTIVTVITSIVDMLTDPDNLEMLIDAALTLVFELAKGLIQAIPQLVSAAFQIIKALCEYLWDNKEEIFMMAVDLFLELVRAAGEILAPLAEKVAEIVASIKQWFIDKVEDIKDAGRQLLEGLWAGITDKVEWLKGKVMGVVDTIKGWFTGKDGFDEHSPSKWAADVFANVLEGGEKGLNAAMPSLMSDVDDAVDSIKAGFDLGTQSVGVSARGSGGYGGASGMVDRPIEIPLILDGAVLARATYRYNQSEMQRHGTSLVYA